MSNRSEMMNRADFFSKATLAEIKALVQKTEVDTNLATAQAAQIEENFLANESRDMKVAVFLAGLMANLIE